MPRVGRHRSDRRWEAEDGVEWASRFEHDVYHRLRDNGYRTRKCDESDSISYQSSVKQGLCLECSSTHIVQQRTYTPDLYVVGGIGFSDGRGSVIECKGKFTGDKRKLFREIAAQWEGTDLCIVFQGNKLPGIKSSAIAWCQKYCKNVTPGLWKPATKTRESNIIWYPSGDSK